MALVPILDLREPRPDGPGDVFSNIEAEQALLGVLLFAGAEAVDRLAGGLKPEHLSEPFHQRLFESIISAVAAGYGVEVLDFHAEFRNGGAYEQLGGLRYLADLVDRAPPLANLRDYERILIEGANRRRLIEIADWMTKAAKGEIIPRDTGRLASATDIMREAEAAFTDMQIDARVDALIDIGEAAAGVLDYVDDRSKAVGITTGLRPLDLQIGPLLPGDVILAAGRPSMGKSALGIAICTNVAAPHIADMMNGVDYDRRPPAGVIELHGEMSFGTREAGGQTVRRHLADIGFGMFGKAFPSFKQMRDKTVTVDQRAMMERAAAELKYVPIRGLKRTGLTVSALRGICRRQVVEWDRAGIPLGLLMIDHVGLLRPEGRVSGRYEAQTEIAIALKELADELKAPVLALVQLSREVEKRDDKRPQLSDLKDSGAWEENADAVLFPFRDAYYAKKEKEPDADRDVSAWASWDRRCRSMDIEIIVGKLREGDAGSSATVWGGLPWNAIRGAEPDSLVGGLDFSGNANRIDFSKLQKTGET